MAWYNPFTWGSDDDEAKFTAPTAPVDTPYVNPYAGLAPPPPPTNAGAGTTQRTIDPYNPADVGDPNGDYAVALQSNLNAGNRGVDPLYQGSTLEMRDEGTSYGKVVNANPGQQGFDPYVTDGGYDRRNYMYGRTPGGADAAVSRAQQTGDAAQGYGMGVSKWGFDAAQQYANRGAQQGQWGQQNQALAGAGSYGNQLAGLEATQGPSAAQAQLQQGTNQAMGSQVALARSGRGFGGGAAATGQAQSNLAGIQANQANQAGALRAQEDAAWRARQAGNLGQAANIQQGIGQQYGQQAQADLGAYYQNQGQNDSAAMGFAGLGAQAGQQGYQTNLLGQGLGNDIRGTEQAGNLAQEDNILREMAARQGWTLGQQQRQDQKDAATLNAVTTGVATVSSDVRAKKDIVRSDAPAISFARGTMPDSRAPDTAALDAVASSPGYGFQYIDPSAPGAESGQQYGPMAQDLASTPAGATAVKKGPDGKLGIDPARLTTLNTSAISAQQRELDDIKKQIALFSQQPGASYPRPSSGSF